MDTHPPSFEQWSALVPSSERTDPLWHMKAYQLSRFSMQAAWPDVNRLLRHRLGRSVAEQLWRSLGSVPANLAEGYSRSSGVDRVRMFEYALVGSVRESVVWYRSSEPLLGAETVEARLGYLTQVRRILLTAIPRERRRRIDGGDG